MTVQPSCTSVVTESNKKYFSIKYICWVVDRLSKDVLTKLLKCSIEILTKDTL